jgi:hypothetical protein
MSGRHQGRRCQDRYEAALNLLRILSDIDLGMLASAETVSVVAETLHAQGVPIVVLDPVCLHFVILLYQRRCSRESKLNIWHRS